MNRGFSLIETLAYIGVLAVIFLVFTNAMLAINRSYAAVRALMTTNESAIISIERMVREARSSTSVDSSSVLGVNPGMLTLDQVDGSGTISTVTFLLLNQTLHIEKNGVDQGALLPPSVTVPRLVFYKLSSGVSAAVKMEMQLTDKEAGAVRTASYYDTAILRRSYNQ